MMTTQETSARSGASGCGCGGGSGSGSSGGTGCGCSGLAQPGTTAAFMRPKFFPGQLLTEDDLEQMTSYVVAKNRLHNRFLFGKGVVAGLLVRPDPSRPALVKVGAGYALDGHGNDVVIPFPHELDIPKMVRDLVRARLGAQCEPSTATDSTPADVDRFYGLYLRYHEQPAEPVAPYTVGEDPCAAQSCQFSRIQEGYALELRCYSEASSPTGFKESLRQCTDIPGYPELGREIALIRQRAEVMQEALGKLPPIIIRDRVHERIDYTFTDEDITAAEQLRAGFGQALPLEGELGRLEQAASLIARYDVRANDQKTSPAIDALRGLFQRRLQEVVQQNDPSPLFLALTQNMTRLSEMMSGPGGSLGRMTFETRLLVGGAVLDAESYGAYRTLLAQLPLKLQVAVAEREPSPLLMTQLRLIGSQPSLPEASPALEQEQTRQLADRLGLLAKALDQYQRECLCPLIQPPCAPVGDPAVLLARITVRNDCEVREICNMERQLVLSPAAMQYWMGSHLHAALEQYCCEPLPGKEPPPTGGETPRILDGNALLTALVGASRQVAEPGRQRMRRVKSEVKPVRTEPAASTSAAVALVAAEPARAPEPPTRAPEPPAPAQPPATAESAPSTGELRSASVETRTSRPARKTAPSGGNRRG